MGRAPRGAGRRPSACAAQRDPSRAQPSDRARLRQAGAPPPRLSAHREDRLARFHVPVGRRRHRPRPASPRPARARDRRTRAPRYRWRPEADLGRQVAGRTVRPALRPGDGSGGATVLLGLRHGLALCLAQAEALALVARQGFGPSAEYEPKVPQTAQALLKYLRMARKRGFSTVTQTYSNRMSTIATPIRDATSHEVAGTISIAGPHAPHRGADAGICSVFAGGSPRIVACFGRLGSTARRARQCLSRRTRKRSAKAMAHRARKSVEGALPQACASPSPMLCAAPTCRPRILIPVRRPGEVAEWSIAPHSKCGVRASVPGVRIPPSPPRPKLLI
jgi:Bacterial transcriptional regulator